MLVPARDYRQVMEWRRTNPAARAWWREVRAKVAERASYECAFCHRHCPWREGQCHHTPEAYRHVGNEDRYLHLMRWVHAECHRKHHEKERRKRAVGRVFGWW